MLQRSDITHIRSSASEHCQDGVDAAVERGGYLPNASSWGLGVGCGVSFRLNRLKVRRPALPDVFLLRCMMSLCVHLDPGHSIPYVWTPTICPSYPFYEEWTTPLWSQDDKCLATAGCSVGM